MSPETPPIRRRLSRRAILKTASIAPLVAIACKVPFSKSAIASAMPLPKTQWHSIDASMVATLGSALEHPSPRVRNAAIRGLGATRTPAAIQVLRKAGKEHPDPATRRLARAEAQRLS
jgi:predicted secreted Zn-dependent protease